MSETALRFGHSRIARPVSSSKIGTYCLIPFRFGIVTVGTRPPHHQEDQHTDDGYADNTDISPVPTVMLRHEAQPHIDMYEVKM